TKIVKVKAYTAQRTTYDLSIDGLHTYHVLAGTTSVLVHNCDEEGWVPDENYSKKAIEDRRKAFKAYYETPQDIHDLVTAVISNPNYPQRLTGSAGNMRLDFYEARGAPRAARRWEGAAIYDNLDPRSQARILVDSDGNIAYVGRTKKGAHNYNQIIPYPWATRPKRS
ncbi:hypothetical protein, partial [Streptomyces sp. F-3]